MPREAATSEACTTVWTVDDAVATRDTTPQSPIADRALGTRRHCGRLPRSRLGSAHPCRHQHARRHRWPLCVVAHFLDRSRPGTRGPRPTHRDTDRPLSTGGVDELGWHTRTFGALESR